MSGPEERLHDFVVDIATKWQTGSILVVGPLGTGRMTILRAAASLLENGGRPALEFVASPYSTLEDLVGHHAPSLEAGKKAELRFVPGLLLEAMRDGRRFIVAEADQLAGDARAAILAVLRGQSLPALQAGYVTTIIRPGFALAATASHKDFELADAFAQVVTVG